MLEMVSTDKIVKMPKNLFEKDKIIEDDEDED